MSLTNFQMWKFQIFGIDMRTLIGATVVYQCLSYMQCGGHHTGRVIMLKCLAKPSINGKVLTNSSYHSYPTRCPEAYDYLGHVKQTPHMCTSASKKYGCVISIADAVVTKGGSLIDCHTLTFYSISHESMVKMPPLYYPAMHNLWSRYYEVLIDLNSHSLT